MFGLSTTMLVLTVVAVLGSGALTAWLLIRFSTSGKRITLWEYVICAVLLLVLGVPGVGAAGSAIAQADAVGGYKEFWNGTMRNALSQETFCDRDGACSHTYECDPYQVTETYYETEYYTTTETTVDSQGRVSTRPVTRSQQVPKTREVTKYHSCPYATLEYDYWLVDTFDRRHDIASGVFAADAREWRPGSGLPGDVARGAPPKWAAAKRNIDAGDPDPVTVIHNYTNYLLASQDSILKAWSDSIDRYKREGLMPLHTLNLTDDPIIDGYRADKMVFAGMRRPPARKYNEWQLALGRVNAKTGDDLQGDVHVVAVPASKVDDPDDYANALLAYWQSRELDKLGLAKNTIMIVVGVDAKGKTVKWARAKTGIPEGNGEMLASLSTKLPDTKFEPRALIGWPKAKVRHGDITFSDGHGAIETIITHDYPFKRACMEHCDDPGDNGTGYVYLAPSAYISDGAQLGMSGAVFLVGAVLFALAGALHFGNLWPWIQRKWGNVRGFRRRSTFKRRPRFPRW
jgi:hypothetical protein